MKKIFYSIIGLFAYWISCFFTVPAALADSAPPITTAFGSIPFPTDPAGFVGRIFGIILSLSGAVALIIIVFSGFRLSFSQGNQEKVQEAREMLTAAVIGLLFIIFSTTLLEVIGVDILGLTNIFH